MPKRRICVLVTARPSYSRIRSALRAIQDASRPRAAARRRCVGAARTLRQRDPGDRARRLHAGRAGVHGARGREPGHLGEVHRHRTVRARHGVRQPEARRGGDGCRSVRDARDGGCRGLHEHPAGARAGRGSDRLDRREGPSCGHQAGEPAPRVDEAGARAGDQARRSARLGRAHRLPVDRHRGGSGGTTAARLRSVRALRRRRSARGPVRRATSW